MPLVLPCAAVLFDNDGVLVDSKAAGNIAWTRWSHVHGLDPVAVLTGVHGRRSRETVALFLAADLVDEATAEIDLLELGHSGTTIAVPGAAVLMGAIPDVARALVTSASRDLAVTRLRAAGVPVPATVVAAEHVSAGKPDPAPYLLAAQRLGVDPSACVVLEDSDNGILSARAAGVGAVLGVSASAVGLGCDAVVRDLSGVRWTGNGLELEPELERSPEPARTP